jgi:Rad4 transglutaminase-like domain
MFYIYSCHIPLLLDCELMITHHLMHSDVRYVLDLTDHVWAEVWVPALGRYVHLDPCERAFDKPLMYESGWNKNLTHVISFSRYGAVNATSRYTRKLAQVILRSADADTR